MEKEFLTKGRIKADLQLFIAKHVLAFIVSLIFLAICCIFTKIFLDKNYKLFLIFSIFFSVVLAFSVIRSIIKIILTLHQIKNNNYIIKNDFVIEKLYKKVGRRYTPNRPYTLIFANNGKYGIYDGTHYKWSKLYAMKEREVYESTALKDEFYVIMIKKEVVLAYNKRYFELET